MAVAKGTFDRRRRLIDTALALFSSGGYHATGIDRITAASGVAKMTLYKNFRTKDALIVAALETCDAAFREWIAAEIERRAKTPEQKLLAFFDAYGAWFEGGFNGKFTGCSFVKAAGEYADPHDPIRAVAAAHKKAVLREIITLATEASLREAETISRQLFLLLEGALSVATLQGNAASIRDAKAAASALISLAS